MKHQIRIPVQCATRSSLARAMGPRRKNGQPRTVPVYVRDRETGRWVPVDHRTSEVMRQR